MSRREDNEASREAQAAALREALRRREATRDGAAARGNRAAPGGPPDLTDVFGKLFAFTRRGTKPALQDKADSTRAAGLRSPRDTGRRGGAERPSGWRARLQQGLDAAREQVERLRAEEAHKAAESSEAAEIRAPAPARVAGASRASAARRDSGPTLALDSSAIDAFDSVPAASSSPLLGRVRSGVQRGRRARLKQQFREPKRVRELLVANELLGKPLALRRTRR